MPLPLASRTFKNFNAFPLEELFGFCFLSVTLNLPSCFVGLFLFCSFIEQLIPSLHRRRKVSEYEVNAPTWCFE